MTISPIVGGLNFHANTDENDGLIGCGKSLLLMSILGEVSLLSGTIYGPASHNDSIPAPDEQDDSSLLVIGDWIRPDQVAYVAQEPLVFHGSIRDNILYGLPYGRERYWECLRQVRLLPDLELFDRGDQTEIGERGVTLVSELVTI